MEIPASEKSKAKVPSVGGGGVWKISGASHCMGGEFEQIITKLKDNYY